MIIIYAILGILPEPAPDATGLFVDDAILVAVAVICMLDFIAELAVMPAPVAVVVKVLLMAGGDVTAGAIRPPRLSCA